MVPKESARRAASQEYRRARRPDRLPRVRAESGRERRILVAVDGVNEKTKEKVLARHAGEIFHNPEHPEAVGQDARLIMNKAIECGLVEKNGPEDIAIRVAIPAHDMVVEYVIQKMPHGTQRVRLRGFEGAMPKNVSEMRLAPRSDDDSGNERTLAQGTDGEPVVGNEERSWREVEAEMEEIDPEGLIFTPQVRERVKACIRATYPDAGPAPFPEGVLDEEGTITVSKDSIIVKDPITGKEDNIADVFGRDGENRFTAFKFDQPINADSGLDEIATAFGDLLYGLRDDFETYKKTSNGEFLELNDRRANAGQGEREMQTIGEKIRSGVDALSEAEKAHIVNLALGWLKSQPGFLLWQKIRFENIINTNRAINTAKQGAKTQRFKIELRQMHYQGNANILKATERWREAEQKYGDLRNTINNTPANKSRFEELLREVGFTV